MSNLASNRVNATMTAAQVAAVKSALNGVISNLPVLVGLTSEERMALPKISKSNKLFTEDAANLLNNNGSMFPSYVNAASIQNDLTYWVQLDELIPLVRQLLERMEDTQMLAGSEAYSMALAVYRLADAAAKGGVSGADTVYQQLRERFEGQGVAKNNPEPGATGTVPPELQ